jgi:hypothetical protein
MSENNYLVRVVGKVGEEVSGDIVHWPIEEQFGDSISIKIGLVTNTPGDHIGIAALHITVMGDGFFLINRSHVGGDSEFIASGKLDNLEGMQHYGEQYAAIQRALWIDRQKREPATDQPQPGDAEPEGAE